MRPDDAFRVSTVRDAIASRGNFDRVLVHKSSDGNFVFEAYPASGEAEGLDSTLVEMLTVTYGADIDVRTTSNGEEEYYDIRMSEGGVLDDRNGDDF